MPSNHHKVNLNHVPVKRAADKTVPNPVFAL